MKLLVPLRRDYLCPEGTKYHVWKEEKDWETKERILLARLNA